MAEPVRLDCTAIVPTLDRPEWLAACLASLAAARPPLREVLVADQGHADPAVEGACVRHGAVHLRLERRGLSYARNHAARGAQGEWLFFPDDDCTVAPDLLARLAESLARHPGCGFACAHLATPAGRPLMLGMDGRERTLPRVLDLMRTVMSPGLFVRRDRFEGLGGFDERLGLGGRWPSGEESDLVIRARAAGAIGIYAPLAHVQHPDQFAIRAPGAQLARAFQYGRGWGALFAKNAGGPLGTEVRAAHRHYLTRALGGALASAARGRVHEVRRYVASWQGRRAGWREFRAARAAGA